MKPTRPPEPKVGDMVKLRGREPRGELKYVGIAGWSRVEWVGEQGPKIVGISELEKV